MAPPPPPSDSGSAFELLAEGVQRQLYRMRWTSLRPVQVDAIRTFLGSSADMLIMAETAGGKTEAAFLPVLSSISQEATGSVRAVYVGPLKALINDQFGRLEELCTYLDMPVHRWHGDVPASRKDQLLREPSGVLLITPESLESLLINRTRHLPGLFGGLRAVVIDEVHSFLDTERGMHLASLLVRIKRYKRASEPATRTIGLSATVGDVGVAQRYLAPDAPERVAIISDLGGTKELQFRIHGYLKPESSADNTGNVAGGHAGEPPDGDLKVMGAIAADLVEHCRGSSNLVFANAKGDIELYVDLANEHCRAAGLPESFLVHHGSLAKEVREDTEHSMKSGGMFTTVCSSTLEMGIDIGSVRMAVLAVHVGGERWVGETTKLVGWSQPQVSVALRDFRVSGWMTSVRKGRYDFYSLTTLVGVRIEGPHLIVDVEGNHGERLWLVRLHGLSAALCPPNPATTPPDDGDGKDLRPSQPGRLSGEERRAAPDIVLRTLNDGSAHPRPADTTGPT